jgi:hypothetical protein
VYDNYFNNQIINFSFDPANIKQTKEIQKEIYNRNIELQKAGSFQDYINYLTKVFPDSILQELLYHTSNVRNIQKFDISKVGSHTDIGWHGHGIYLQEREADTSYGDNIYLVLSNINKKSIYFNYELISDRTENPLQRLIGLIMNRGDFNLDTEGLKNIIVDNFEKEFNEMFKKDVELYIKKITDNENEYYRLVKSFVLTDLPDNVKTYIDDKFTLNEKNIDQLYSNPEELKKLYKMFNPRTYFNNPNLIYKTITLIVGNYIKDNFKNIFTAQHNEYIKKALIAHIKEFISDDIIINMEGIYNTLIKKSLHNHEKPNLSISNIINIFKNDYSIFGFPTSEQFNKYVKEKLKDKKTSIIGKYYTAHKEYMFTDTDDLLILGSLEDIFGFNQYMNETYYDNETTNFSFNQINYEVHELKENIYDKNIQLQNTGSFYDYVEYLNNVFPNSTETNYLQHLNDNQNIDKSGTYTQYLFMDTNNTLTLGSSEDIAAFIEYKQNRKSINQILRELKSFKQFYRDSDYNEIC